LVGDKLTKRIQSQFKDYDDDKVTAANRVMQLIATETKAADAYQALVEAANKATGPGIEALGVTSGPMQADWSLASSGRESSVNSRSASFDGDVDTGALPKDQSVPAQADNLQDSDPIATDHCGGKAGHY
jgi:hypothetical protein